LPVNAGPAPSRGTCCRPQGIGNPRRKRMILQSSGTLKAVPHGKYPFYLFFVVRLPQEGEHPSQRASFTDYILVGDVKTVVMILRVHRVPIVGSLNHLPGSFRILSPPTAAN